MRLSTIIAWTNSEGIDLVEDIYDPKAWRETAGKIGDAAHRRFGVIVGSVSDEGEGNDVVGTAVHAAGDVPGDTPDFMQGNMSDPSFTHTAEAECARRERCRACYRMRLEQSARYAAENGFDALGTTLSVSPYQYTDIIAEELERACDNVDIRAFFEDYRPYYDEATRRSREAGMYRQNYCGCHYSLEEAEAERNEQKRIRAAIKREKRLAHAEERAAEEASRAIRRAERAAYDAKQARRHEILRNLRMQQKADAEIEQIDRRGNDGVEQSGRHNEIGINRADRRSKESARTKKRPTQR